MRIAIIGSGPAGCYLAENLLRLIPDASVDILEKLPVPFGLIRYGVAPDHQSTKNVARLFDRLLSRDRVQFFGNVEVGRDVKLDELRELYDVVVLATGAPRDRQLRIEGEDLPGVMGSGAFVGWYNGHPHATPPSITDVREAVIIGNGNVALDVARILAKGQDEFTGSDLPRAVQAWLESQPIQEIHVVGRRSAAETKFNEHELAELGTLQRASPRISSVNQLSSDGGVGKVLRSFAEAPQRTTPVSIHFHFNLTPAAFLGDERLRAVQFRSAAGETIDLPAQLAVTCIGYQSVACCSASPDDGRFANHDGKIADRLYVAGWAKRGPSGTIPTNRTEAQLVAQKIVAEEQAGNRPGTEGLRELLRQRGCCVVDYAGWRRIEAAELSCRNGERCREKICRTEEMLEVALAQQPAPS